MARRIAAALIAVSLVACGPSWYPPEPAPERGPTAVAAPFDATWNAVIDVFATRSIPIATIEKASGLIVAVPLPVGAEGAGWADCGRSRFGKQLDPKPSRGEFNVVVRNEPAGSTVRVTMRWASISDHRQPVVRSCETTGVWERDLESQVKAKAEGKTG